MADHETVITVKIKAYVHPTESGAFMKEFKKIVTKKFKSHIVEIDVKRSGGG